MGVYSRGGTYWMSYMIGGEQKRESCQTSNKRDAEERYAARITAIKEGRFFDIQKVELIIFKEFADRYIEEHSKINKKSWEDDVCGLKDLKAEFGEKYLQDIKTADIVKFKAKQTQKISGHKRITKVATINRKLTLLKAILNKAIEWDALKGPSPAAKVTLFKENNTRDRFLNREELENLYAQCNGELLHILKVAVHTGLRQGEIMGLTWKDIDINRKLIYVRRSNKSSYSTKSSKNRVVPMNDIVLKVFLSILKQPDSDFIFDNTHRNGFLAALVRAKITDFKFHDLRHTFASNLVMAGVPINTIRELLGHSTINMVLRYAHLAPDHKSDSVEKLITILSQSNKISEPAVLYKVVNRRKIKSYKIRGAVAKW
ncbi:MAG: site-specific integrase [Candidatus Omnitrophica bacterium]|nr:site-specific integrase [Candidatus Omnitrophota bacterium]